MPAIAAAFGKTFEQLLGEATEQGLIQDLIEDDGLPMIKFPDGENWTFNNEVEVAIALASLIKGADMQRFNHYSDD